MVESLTSVLGSSWAPLALCGALFAVTVVKSMWLRIAYGANPYVIDHSDPIHGFVGRVFAFIVCSALLYVSAIAAWPAVELVCGPVLPMFSLSSRLPGGLLMVIAVLWTGYSQLSMGSSWRIGIPQHDIPPLRTSGPFSVSRNPIFLGMLVFMLGVAVWSANAVTLVLLVASYISLEVQIRAEEVFLARQHGDAYQQYRARVRRWV